MFGIHLDESTHHKKVRLEFWMVFDSKKERREKYLKTKELNVDFDLQLLLKSDVTSLDDLKLVDSEKVFEKFLEVLKDFNLDVLNLRLLSPSKYKSLLFESDKPKFFCNKVKDLRYTLHIFGVP